MAGLCAANLVRKSKNGSLSEELRLRLSLRLRLRLNAGTLVDYAFYAFCACWIYFPDIFTVTVCLLEHGHGHTVTGYLF